MIKINPFSTVTRRILLMSRSIFVPSLISMMSRAPGCGSCEAAVSEEGVAFSFSALEVVLRVAPRVERDGRVRAGFAVADFRGTFFSFARLDSSFGSIGEVGGADSGVVALDGSTFVSLSDFFLAGSVRAVVRLGVLDLLVVVRREVVLGVAGVVLFFSAAGSGSGVDAVASLAGSSIRAPTALTRRTFLSALLIGVGVGSGISDTDATLLLAGMNDPPKRIW